MTPELRSYIQEARAEGFSDDHIAETLRSAEWSDDAIAAALKDDSARTETGAPIPSNASADAPPPVSLPSDIPPPISHVPATREQEATIHATPSPLPTETKSPEESVGTMLDHTPEGGASTGSSPLSKKSSIGIFLVILLVISCIAGGVYAYRGYIGSQGPKILSAEEVWSRFPTAMRSLDSASGEMLITIKGISTPHPNPDSYNEIPLSAQGPTTLNAQIAITASTTGLQSTFSEHTIDAIVQLSGSITAPNGPSSLTATLRLRMVKNILYVMLLDYPGSVPPEFAGALASIKGQWIAFPLQKGDIENMALSNAYALSPVPLGMPTTTDTARKEAIDIATKIRDAYDAHPVYVVASSTREDSNNTPLYHYDLVFNKDNYKEFVEALVVIAQTSAAQGQYPIDRTETSRRMHDISDSLLPALENIRPALFIGAIDAYLRGAHLGLSVTTITTEGTLTADFTAATILEHFNAVPPALAPIDHVIPEEDLMRQMFGFTGTTTEGIDAIRK